MHFSDQSGQPLALPVPNSSSGDISATLGAGQSWFAETSGASSTLVQGWAEIASSGRLGITAIFRQSTPGRPDSEATVPATGSSSRVVFPYDNMQGFATGVAVVNGNPNLPADVSILFRPEGRSEVAASLTIPKRGQVAVMLPTTFPTIANSRGAVELSSSTTNLSAVALRFSPNGSFTSLPGFNQ